MFELESYRICDDWDFASNLAKQRAGRIRRGTKVDTWIFEPSSAHAYDIFTDAERHFLKRLVFDHSRFGCPRDDRIRAKFWGLVQVHARDVLFQKYDFNPWDIKSADDCLARLQELSRIQSEDQKQMQTWHDEERRRREEDDNK